MTRQESILVEAIFNIFPLFVLVLHSLAYWLKQFIYENSNIKQRTLNWIFLLVYIAVWLFSGFAAYKVSVWDHK